MNHRVLNDKKLIVDVNEKRDKNEEENESSAFVSSHVFIDMINCFVCSHVRQPIIVENVIQSIRFRSTSTRREYSKQSDHQTNISTDTIG